MAQPSPLYNQGAKRRSKPKPSAGRLNGGGPADGINPLQGDAVGETELNRRGLWPSAKPRRRRRANGGGFADDINPPQSDGAAKQLYNGRRQRRPKQRFRRMRGATKEALPTP